MGSLESTGMVPRPREQAQSRGVANYLELEDTADIQLRPGPGDSVVTVEEVEVPLPVQDEEVSIAMYGVLHRAVCAAEDGRGQQG